VARPQRAPVNVTCYRRSCGPGPPVRRVAPPALASAAAAAGEAWAPFARLHRLQAGISGEFGHPLSPTATRNCGGDPHGSGKADLVTHMPLIGLAT